MTKEKSKEVGRAVVAKLGLSGDDLNALKRVPYKELETVANEAKAEILGVREPGSSEMIGLVPVHDGETLLQLPFTQDIADLSKDIPLMNGTTVNELDHTTYDEKDLN